MQLLPQEHLKDVISTLGLRGGEHVLDVGCGTGEFTQYLSQGVTCSFTGIDLEEKLIEAANNRGLDQIMFLQGDALQLPFADNSFDVVVSHAFFTCVSDAWSAMQEMRRVCKPGGRIASVTAESFSRIPYSMGHYPEYPWLKEYQVLKEKLDRAFYQLATVPVAGVPPEEMPRFFYESGWKNITVQQIGKFFSLSNGNMDAEWKKQYLECEFEAECSRLWLLGETEQTRYRTLLEEKGSCRSRKWDLAMEWRIQSVDRCR